MCVNLLDWHYVLPFTWHLLWSNQIIQRDVHAYVRANTVQLVVTSPLEHFLFGRIHVKMKETGEAYFWRRGVGVFFAVNFLYLNITYHLLIHFHYIIQSFRVRSARPKSVTFFCRIFHFFNKKGTPFWSNTDPVVEQRPYPRTNI